MNIYYHSFAVGFNWYQLAAPLMLLWMAAFGSQQFWLTKRLRIRRVFRDGWFTLFSVVGGVIFALLLVFESGAGILQWLDNSLAADDSPALSLLLWPFTVAGVTTLFSVMMYTTGKCAGWLKHGRLIEKKRWIMRERHLDELTRIIRQVEEDLRKGEILSFEKACQEEAIRHVEEAAKLERQELERTKVIKFRPAPYVMEM